ncbi:MAG: hypothetical protein WKG07_22210 [Hymenobacter sp.]
MRYIRLNSRQINFQEKKQLATLAHLPGQAQPRAGPFLRKWTSASGPSAGWPSARWAS